MAALSDTVIKILVVRRYLYAGRLALNGQKGSDFWKGEVKSIDYEAVRLAQATGLPVWAGFSAMMADDGVSVLGWRIDNTANTLPPDNFGALVGANTPLSGGAAAGVMYSRVEDTGPALGQARIKGPLP